MHEHDLKHELKGSRFITYFERRFITKPAAGGMGKGRKLRRCVAAARSPIRRPGLQPAGFARRQKQSCSLPIGPADLFSAKEWAFMHMLATTAYHQSGGSIGA